MPENHLVLAGNSSYSNRGCEGIVRGTVAALDQTGFSGDITNIYFNQRSTDTKEGGWDEKITYISFDPRLKGKPLSRNWLARKIVSRFNPEIIHTLRKEKLGSLSKYFKNASAVLMLGGDNYSMDYGRPDIYFKLNRSE